MDIAGHFSHLFGEQGPFFESWLKDLEEVLQRPGLDRKTRLLCFVSLLTAQGQKNFLKAFIGAALEAGCTTREIYEVILQNYLFAGYPAAIEGFRVFQEVVREKPRPHSFGDAQQWKSQGLTLCRQVYGEEFEGLMKHMRGLSPELAEWMVVEGYGKVLSRPGLGVKERELCAIATLLVCGWERQLRSHIRGALNVGATVAEVEEVILQLRPLMGLPIVQLGMELLVEVVE